MKFLRDFTQPDLTLSNPNEYSFAGRPEVERIVSNMKKWRTRAFSSSALSDMRKLLLGGKQCLLSFTKHQLTPIGPERLERQQYSRSPFLQSYYQINLLSNLVLRHHLWHHLSDGNDKIEEKLKDKQKKNKGAPTKASQKPKQNKRKRVDLTFDYDPEKECE